jgi:hypothetical protein
MREGAGQAWVDEVNRIAHLLGLDVHAQVVRQRRVDGKVQWVAEEGCLSRKELSTFPYSVRSKEFYQMADALAEGMEEGLSESGWTYPTAPM